VGQQIVVTNHANAQVIFSLDPVAPAGAQLTNGIFRWTPSCGQGSSTNIITIWATDVLYPTVSNHMTFLVSVGDCVQLGVGSSASLSGQETCVPVQLANASSPLNHVQFTLQFPPNQVANLSISSTNIAVGAAILQSFSSTQAVFSVGALTGRTFQAPTILAEVCLQASGPQSGFLPLLLTGIQGTKTNGAAVGNPGGTPGQIVVLADQPLLQASPGTNATLTLTLYGIPGSNYVIQSASDLSGSWQPGLSVTPSRVNTPITVGGVSTNAIQFYRVYRP
jgi:hypothetical protein